MKKKTPKPKSKRVVWSFEPDQDVVDMVNAALAKDQSKDRTELLNEAVRTRFPERFLPLAKQRLEEAKALVDLLQNTVERNRSKPDSE